MYRGMGSTEKNISPINRTMKEVIHLKSRLSQETVPYTGAMEMLECSRCKICELCKSGELVSIIHAGKRRIYIDSIEAYSVRIREKAMKEVKT